MKIELSLAEFEQMIAESLGEIMPKALLPLTNRINELAEENKQLRAKLSRYTEGEMQDLSYAADRMTQELNTTVFTKDGEMRTLPEVLNELARNWARVHDTTTYWGGRPIESYNSIIMDENTWHTVQLKENYYINFISSTIDIPYRVATFELVNKRTGQSVIMKVNTDISIRRP